MKYLLLSSLEDYNVLEDVAYSLSRYNKEYINIFKYIYEDSRVKKRLNYDNSVSFDDFLSYLHKISKDNDNSMLSELQNMCIEIMYKDSELTDDISLILISYDSLNELDSFQSRIYNALVLNMECPCYIYNKLSDNSSLKNYNHLELYKSLRNIPKEIAIKSSSKVDKRVKESSEKEPTENQSTFTKVEDLSFYFFDFLITRIIGLLRFVVFAIFIIFAVCLIFPLSSIILGDKKAEATVNTEVSQTTDEITYIEEELVYTVKKDKQPEGYTYSIESFEISAKFEYNDEYYFTLLNYNFENEYYDIKVPCSTYEKYNVYDLIRIECYVKNNSVLLILE